MAAVWMVRLFTCLNGKQWISVISFIISHQVHSLLAIVCTVSGYIFQVRWYMLKVVKNFIRTGHTNC